MKKLMLIFLFIVIFIYFITPSRVTPKGYFHVSKITRKNMINNLKSNCSSEDTICLISTYYDVFNDKNTSSCWGEYRKKCFYNKENNLSLKIPIKCKTY